MRLAITGATGRLGTAISDRCAARNWIAAPWTRADFDLDAPGDVEALLRRDRPNVVIHCAAWTDVDGCAREPERAEQRNGHATAAIAAACAGAGIGLVAVSTNEVFDGRRTDGVPYGTGDPTAPANAYGRSKRLGELGAITAFGTDAERLWIVRTSWLFGVPGADFPSKILAAAAAAKDGRRTLALVADEVGRPTAAADLAEGILDLVGAPGSGGIHHVVNTGIASRADWARRVFDLAGVDVSSRDVSIDEFPRISTPPRWGVLEPTALPTIGHLRPWQEALQDDLGARGLLSYARGRA